MIYPMKSSKVQNRSTKSDPVIQELPLACADEAIAVHFIEKQRWGDTPCCPRCGDMDVYTMLDSKTGERQKDFRWRCRGCKQQFTVRIGTVFEDSRIPLRHWCFAFWRASTSKKGVSALEIHRQTGLSYKSALFMLDRIRYAMAPDTIERGMLSGTVEVDETYVGGKPRNRSPSFTRAGRRRGRGTLKQPILGMVQRGGDVRVRAIPRVNTHNLKENIRAYVDSSSKVMTDELNLYKWVGKEFADHQTVCHSAGEYVRGEVHINTSESFFALLKRSLHGIYHSVSRKHLPLYLAHAEFLYNNRKLEDGARALAAIKACDGKRLTYKELVGN